MSKRFTDTAKWKSPKFRALPTKIKVLYLYMLDECDLAGVMVLDLDMISYQLNERYSLEEVKASLGERLIFVSDEKIVIRNYVLFQQPNLKENSNIEKHIRNCFSSHGLLDRYRAGEFGADALKPESRPIPRLLAPWEQKKDSPGVPN